MCIRDSIRTLSPLVRLFFGELIATMRSTLPDPKSEPWPVMVMLEMCIRDSAEILAKFPDEGPLSETLAKHLAQSPVMAVYAEEERQRSDFAADPAQAISTWVERSNAQIDRLPWDAQDELRAEMQGIAKEAAAAFGLDRETGEREAPPRSTLYSTSISADALAVGGTESEFHKGSANTLRACLLYTSRCV